MVNRDTTMNNFDFEILSTLEEENGNLAEIEVNEVSARGMLIMFHSLI